MAKATARRITSDGSSKKAAASDRVFDAALRKFEELLPEYIENVFERYPLARQAHALAHEIYPDADDHLGSNSPFMQALTEILSVNGGDAVGTRGAKLSRELRNLANIIAASATSSPSAIRGKVLVTIFEGIPTADHEGELDLGDGDAVYALRRLFDAAAAQCGLTQLVKNIEQDLAADLAGRDPEGGYHYELRVSAAAADQRV